MLSHIAPGEPLPGDEFDDVLDIGATDTDGSVICTCFVYQDVCPWLPARDGAWLLRNMVTAERYRGQGIGATVIEATITELAERGANLLWCKARETAVPFYERHRFSRHGDLFAGGRHGRHLFMWRDLSPSGS